MKPLMISIALLIFAFSAKAQNQFLTTVNNFGPCSVNVQIHWIDAAACTLYASSQVMQLGPAPDPVDYSCCGQRSNQLRTLYHGF